MPRKTCKLGTQAEEQKPYFRRHDKLQVERSMSSKCIDKVDRLLSINLPGNPRNNVLEVEDDLEDLDVCVTVILFSICTNINTLDFNSHDFCCHF
jgi:hypothetical protein